MTKNPAISASFDRQYIVTYIKMKANTFSKFFAEQCSSLNKLSSLKVNFNKPNILNPIRLGSLALNEDETLNIIRALNIHKAHGHDDISISMIKMCDKSILRPYISEFNQVILLPRYMKKI